MVKVLDTLDDFKSTINGNEGKLVVIDFFATWCGPCVHLAPEFEKLAEEHTDVVFVKVDVDKNTEASEHVAITCMPTIFFYKNGEQVKKIEGADLDAIKETITNNK